MAGNLATQLFLMNNQAKHRSWIVRQIYGTTTGRKSKELLRWAFLEFSPSDGPSPGDSTLRGGAIPSARECGRFRTHPRDRIWVGQRQVNQVNGQDPEQNTSSQAVHKVPRAFFNAIREWTFSDLRRLKSHLKFTFDSPRHS
jgi:hypothetical protein